MRTPDLSGGSTEARQAAHSTTSSVGHAQAQRHGLLPRFPRGTSIALLPALASVFLLFIPCAFGFQQQPSVPPTPDKPLLFLAENNDPPLNYAENGVVKGRDVDFANALGKVLGREVRVELTTWDDARQRIEQGEADGFLTIADSEQRREIFEVSEPVFTNDFGTFVRAGEIRIHGIDDLAGRRVGVIGTGSFARQILSRRPEITLVTCTNYADAFGKLASKEIDAVGTQIWLAAYWIQQQSGRNFTLAGEPFASQPVGVGIRKGNLDLVREINHAIQVLKSDGTITRIEAKWRPQEMVFFTRQKIERTVLISVVAFLAVLFVGMSIWIVTLRRQKEQLRFLAHALKSANDCISIADPDDRILLVNDAFRRTYGYEDSEILGQPVTILRAEKNDPNVVNTVLNSTKRGGWRGELWNRSKTGRVFPISLVTTPLTNESGQVIAMIGVARDVTLERKTEDELRASQEKFAKVFQASPDCIVLSQLEGPVLEVNNRFEELTGYAPGEILGRRVKDLNLMVDRSAQDRMVDDLKAGKAVRNMECQLRRRSGEIADIQVSAELINVAGVPCVLCVHRDVTRYRQAEEQLRQAQKMDAVGRLAAGIAHDFNNLLTVILGNCEAMVPQLGNGDEAREAFDDIHAAATRAASLTEQLLAFSRQQSIQPRVLDLNQPLFGLQRLLRRVIGENILMEFVPGDDLLPVKIDEGQLHQIVMNLAVNARDAMPDGGKLLLETRNVNIDQKHAERHREMPAGDYVLLTVSDTGTGLDAATQAKLFEPFFTTKTLGKGTGLGLATVYGIVKQNKGFIWVYSEVGAGTTFKIYLPASQEAPTPADRVAPTIEATTGNETVLLVEDEAALRSMLAKHLTRIGYQVITAQSGEDALESYAKVNPAPTLLVTDVVMPGISGRDLAEKLSTRLPGLKVLYLSGYTDEAVLRHGILPTGSFFLQKPFPLQTFAQKIRDILGSPSVASERLV